MEDPDRGFDSDHSDTLDIDEGPLTSLERQFSTQSAEGETSYDAKVVIVGAGPVGLWVAVQLKLHNPFLAVTVLEKHAVYQRNHVLRLKPRSFKGSLMDERLTQIVARWGKVVKTSTLESDLLAYALDLDVRIEHCEVTSMTDLESTFQEAEAFIGADGYHSTCRQLFFNAEHPQFHETLQHTFL